jgi:predicted enzyme related to lactoylglutathione lyase
MTISAISIFVSDLEAAKSFYADVLGYAVTATFDGYAAKLANEGPSLLVCAGGPAKMGAPYPSGVVLGHKTANLETRIAELKGRVDFVHTSPEPFPAGRYLAFTDPFGIHHELLEYR